MEGVMTDEMRAQDIKLIISAEVKAKMEERMIRPDDIRQVIAQAEATGGKLRGCESGHLLAYLRPASVTFWVEYTPEDGQYLIHNTYSHRLEIKEDAV